MKAINIIFIVFLIFVGIGLLISSFILYDSLTIVSDPPYEPNYPRAIMLSSPFFIFGLIFLGAGILLLKKFIIKPEPPSDVHQNGAKDAPPEETG